MRRILRSGDVGWEYGNANGKFSLALIPAGRDQRKAVIAWREFGDSCDPLRPYPVLPF